MRVINEELEAQARLLADQRNELLEKNEALKASQQVLEDKTKQLELSSKYKSEFLSTMSHELRTPLNSILILSKSLSDNKPGNLNEKQIEHAKVIHSAGSDLLSLINDILDIAKVEEGKMQLVIEPLAIKDLAEHLRLSFEHVAQHRGLEFKVNVAPDAPSTMFTDRQRLEQVLRNFFSNAFKFTHDGSVSLNISAAPGDMKFNKIKPGSGPVIALAVTDTGIGVPKEKQDLIFEAFQQADGTTSRKYGGTGLGLSISREIAYLLGGAITARSTFGEGSTFTLYLPVARPDFAELPAGQHSEDAPAGPDRAEQGAAAGTEPRQSAAPRPQRSRRLLVIEGNQRGLLSLVAESAVADLADNRDPDDPRGPVEIVTAVGAQEAAAVLAAQPCHCVVLEVDLSGGEALRFLEAMDGDSALRTVPVLAHNNRRLDPQRESALQSHAATRPLELLSSLDELRERIALHLTARTPGDVLPLVRTEATGELPAQGIDQGLAGRTVLVVDDDARNVYALTGILELHGMRVLQAENGRKGMETLAEHPETDLVLMDVMMPEMDGYTATAAIRAMPEHARLPIIAVTAKAMPGDREKSLAAGASDYVTKPVDADDLIARVRRRLEG